jgi:hypothetical protein
MAFLSTCVQPMGQGRFDDMSAHQPTSKVLTARKQGMRFRVLGVGVLLLGLGAAGALYEIRTHSSGLAEDQWQAENAKAQSRQMEILYGKMGLLTHELFESSKKPGTQACLIAAASILVAVGCFYAARLSGEDDGAR